eukprot:m.149250 g.149250  ORF g.149250 m.149250 type:complete len:880 (-) comp30646_c0_seq1:102-2741(-)
MHTFSMVELHLLLTVLTLVGGVQASDMPPTTMHWMTASSGSCSFQQTGLCDGNGPLQPNGDKPCGDVIPCNAGDCPSGHCLCADGSKLNPVSCKPGSHQPFKCSDICAGRTGNTTRTVLALSNGFVQVQVDVDQGQLVAIIGNLNASGAFLESKNALASNWALETVDSKGVTSRTSAKPTMMIVSNTTSLVSVKLSGITDHPTSPSASEDWVISLGSGDRGFELNTSGSTVGATNAGDIVSIRHSALFSAISIYALFERGVVQMRSDANTMFAAQDRLPAVYALGGGTSIDLFRKTADVGQQTVLLSQPDKSGFQSAVFGTVSTQDEWVPVPKEFSPRSAKWVASPKWPVTWSTSTDIAGNDRNFPSLNLTTEANIPDYDLESYMTGIYASSVGCLCTYDNEVVAGKRVSQIATTIARPSRGYSGTYNYFDPDNFISLSAMIYSGNPYLMRQARDVVERSGDFLLENGQLPHHFVNDKPTYTALSGATQTGPNTFWTKTALQYAKASGDMEWLKSYMPTLRNSSSFCFNLIDPSEGGLIKAPGSLMIDVFIRHGFTADSNAMMTGFLREFADAEEAVGNSTGATTLRTLAASMQSAMNSVLWASEGKGLGGDDHYVSYALPGTGGNLTDLTYHDFVDYDSNLIAVAHGVPDSDRATKILNRIDKGQCAAAGGGGPQFVSERYYGPKDTTSGNTGDSWCAMGRIAWFDSHARKNIATAESLQVFNQHTMATLQRDLIKNTWMHERYNCDGTQQLNRTEAYFEYPSTVAMLLREIRYGINLGFTNITINPFGVTSYNFHIGNINVDYDQAKVELVLPGQGPKSFQITGMTPNTKYLISVDCDGANETLKAMTDMTGVLSFSAPVDCKITASSTPSSNTPAI